MKKRKELKEVSGKLETVTEKVVEETHNMDFEDHRSRYKNNLLLKEGYFMRKTLSQEQPLHDTILCRVGLYFYGKKLAH